MEIKITTVYDYETYKKFYQFGLFRGKYHKIRKWVLLIFCPTVLIDYFRKMFFSNEHIFLFNKIAFVIILAACLYLFLLYFIMPKIFYGSQKKFIDGLVDFIFTDDKIKIKSLSAKYSGSSEFQYDLLYKVYETNDFFYLYLRKRSAYILRKVDINLDIVDNLRELLNKKLSPKKYIRCI